MAKTRLKNKRMMAVILSVIFAVVTMVAVGGDTHASEKEKVGKDKIAQKMRVPTPRLPNDKKSPKLKDPKDATKGHALMDPNDSDPYYDLLILGIDRRPHQKTGRSDVILIIHFEPGQVSLFSIPRDTLTKVRRKRDKINHAYAYGGVNLSKASIERLLKFKVDNYFILDFETFLKTIDMVKALTDDGRLIGAENFLMSGDNLLKWLRYRSFRGGDRRRAQRHQLFMTRVFKFAQDMYKKHPVIFGQAIKGGLKLGKTDITYDHIEKIMEAYKDYDVDEIERFVLMGYAASRLMGGKKPPKTPEVIKVVDNEKNHHKDTGVKKKTRKARKKPLVFYYIPKNSWSLSKYLNVYRAKGYKLNYKEVDELRK